MDFPELQESKLLLFKPPSVWLSLRYPELADTHGFSLFIC